MKFTRLCQALLPVLIIILAACAPGTQFTPTRSLEPSSLSPTNFATAVPATHEPSSTPTSTDASVNELPDASSYTWTLIQEGFSRPVNLSNAADGSGRLFVVEQRGVIRVMMNGSLLPTPFLDIRDRVGSQGNEQGLLGLAFHPKFIENGTFYLDYTNRDGNTVIARFSAPTSGAFSDQAADPASEQVLLQIDQPFPNHNGGQILFGPDGMLWIGMGDGGSQGDPNGNGQSLQTLLGKILRIDVDHGSPYAIPADNPFASGGGLPEIWAYGLRNPWGVSFDSLNGNLYIADVGQDSWEEINFIQAGFAEPPVNFGWNLFEGTHPYKGSGSTPDHYVAPVYEYSHDFGCSITGGRVYRGSDLPAFYGVYLFGDYCSGRVWGLLQMPDGQWKSSQLFQTKAKISSFGSDEQGELYLLDLQGGLYQLKKK